MRERRHGRKSKHQRSDGYKRQVRHDRESGLIRAVGVTPATAPAASVTETLMADLVHQPVTLREVPIDRAYLSSRRVRERPPDLAI